MRREISLTLVAALSLVAVSAQANDGLFHGNVPQTDVVVMDRPDTYGTASLTGLVVGAYQFQSMLPAGQIWPAVDGVGRFIATSPGWAIATPMLPNGAIVERIDLVACDTDQSAQLELIFGRCATPGGSCTAAVQIFTGLVPGCAVFSANLTTPVIVNNEQSVYLVQMATGTTSATVFEAAKLYYRLRVSAAPPSATFNDVPVSHPQRQFIEALFAAGLTAGCGGGSYCPDAPLTRGQMAIFLATALGLHFPN